MAIDETSPNSQLDLDSSLQYGDETTWKRTTFGSGLVKGLGITLRHLFSRSVTVQYPDEKDPLPPRSRGVIALKEENCTMCMLCGRECPDWCIYIEGHKERREPKEPGKRAKAFNVLDRFAIDYALCMYCGICVEVCPYDALFWSPFYEYAEYDIVELTHEMPRLSEWMYHVLPPAPLDEGARGPEFKLPPKAAPAAAAAPSPAALAAPAPAAAAAAAPATPAPAAPQAPAPAPVATPGGGEDPAAVRKRVYEEELAKGSDPRVAEARSKAAEMRAKKARAAAAAPTTAAGAPPAAAPQAPAAPQPPQPAAPAAPATPAAAPPPAQAPPAPKAAPGAPAAVAGEDPAAARERVYKEELAKGSDPRVAEARSKAAEMRARKALAAGAAPAPAPAAPAPAPSAPEAPPAEPAEPTAAAAAPAAPAGQAIPDPHPSHGQPASAADTLEELREHMLAINAVVPPEQFGALTPEEAAAVRAKVYEDEVAKGTEPAVAESLARLAEVVSLQGFRRPDWK
jgi:formate hydrogenlyase subunit 6/NADH:ubiquinone oxidoreductase subunit I